MSYIRSTSNPEALYIWGTETEAKFSHGHLDIVSVPIEDFNRLIELYVENFHEVPERGIQVGMIKLEETLDFKMKLVFVNQDREIEMWDVTWEYIVNGHMELERRIRRQNRWYNRIIDYFDNLIYDLRN